MKKNLGVELRGMSVIGFQSALDILARSGRGILQISPAAHELTSEETLLFLAKNAKLWASIGVGPLNEMAKRKNLSEEVMLALIDNKNYPKQNFLGKKMLPVSVVLKLIKASDALFHGQMIRSRNIPKDAVIFLAAKADNFYLIQDIAGYYPHFDEKLLDVILRRSDMEELRLECVENETCCNWVYLALASNSEIVMPESLQLRIIYDRKDFPKNHHLKRLSYRKDLTDNVKNILNEFVFD
jgi:hypothetical protein